MFQYSDVAPLLACQLGVVAASVVRTVSIGFQVEIVEPLLQVPPSPPQR
ncbi:hypothetical protein [Phocaeicola vulgatus]|nr:hypothetical protein [Phocaeicola vulgatus]